MATRAGYFFAFWMAAQTRLGVAGVCMSVTPSFAKASKTALITQGVATTVPPSPAPFTQGRCATGASALGGQTVRGSAPQSR